MKKVLRKLPLILILAAIAAGLFYAFSPQPIGVDLARVERGELLETIDAEGKTRIKDRFVVAAPLAGKLRRIDLKPGADVSTPLAVIEPSKPVLLDERTRREAKAKISAAASRLSKAQTDLGRAVVAENFARAEHERQKALGVAASKQELDNTALREETTSRERKAAEFGVEVADFELKVAQAAFDFGLNGSSTTVPEEWKFPIPSPIKYGKVLKVLQESETIVAAGAPLLEVGNPDSLEAEIDVLTTDAVKINDCKRVRLRHWGAKDETIEGSGWRIEPSGFTKVSALGVEEQRVYVIVDFTIPEKFRGTIGEHYRVEASFVSSEQKDVLKVKEGALFRQGKDWAVYVKRGDRAVVQRVKIGVKNGVDAQVLEGLVEGDEVVLHPGDRVKEGALISARSKD